MALKHIKKNMKIGKANEGLKGGFEGQKVMNVKISSFFLMLGPFGTNYYGKSVFSIFKVVKAKKAAIVAINTKLHSGTSGYPKLFF